MCGSGSVLTLPSPEEMRRMEGFRTKKDRVVSRANAVTHTMTFASLPGGYNRLPQP